VYPPGCLSSCEMWQRYAWQTTAGGGMYLLAGKQAVQSGVKLATPGSQHLPHPALHSPAACPALQAADEPELCGHGPQHAGHGGWPLPALLAR